tara:strand:+ start:21 stop:377 length:357 start_codon:yes stop_codon:yes gene_type:complete
MILGQIFGAVGGLATTYLDGKVAVQKANAAIKVKQATGEIDWDIEAIKATQNSWKDEWIILLFSIPLILAFCGDWGNEIVQRGFLALEVMPAWYQYSLGGIVSASIGIRSVSKFFGKK